MPTGRDATRIVARAARHFPWFAVRLRAAGSARLGSARLGSARLELNQRLPQRCVRSYCLFVCSCACVRTGAALLCYAASRAGSAAGRLSLLSRAARCAADAPHCLCGIVVQSLANGVTFGHKEPYMSGLNRFIMHNQVETSLKPARIPTCARAAQCALACGRADLLSTQAQMQWGVRAVVSRHSLPPAHRCCMLHVACCVLCTLHAGGGPGHVPRAR